MTGRFTRRDILVSGVGAASASLLAAPAIAQSWRPSKPIRMIIGDAAGGGTDQVSRIFVEYLSKKLDQPVIADNRPGANGVVAATELKNAPADGYTLLYMVGSALMTQKILHKNLPYDPVKDFEPVAAQPVAGLPLIVNVSTGVKTMDQFVEYARKNPANIGTYGAGSLAHVGVAALERFYKAPFTAVHYRGSGLMWADVAAGSLQGGIASGAVGMNVIQLGKGTALAIQGRNRLSKYPGVPTFLELGAPDPGLSLMSVTGILAPAGLPDSIIDTISKLAVDAGRDEATWEKFMIAGAEQRAIGRADFKRWVTEEGPVWSELTGKLELSPN
ncbi:tripartite tricarboxylate transporter substrate binding protein [Bradyrhizobium sp. LHD-71]|uniref:Bug family tripartite tricarboxylate transporter substrate binding protein n=1 Tax=Bradyrhizobium sp. LHD-71 TaxID=3072141 RepID=UPI00280F6E72|nr:tripartite tricarboxylate transporter substrate binding protein [Bradyrhizobium sp. LHD-71]MDQ8729330.1 tripartite tricarboxylate transporter substrate binding protein [Bradyrhizobium sp. LHD-71]